MERGTFCICSTFFAKSSLLGAGNVGLDALDFLFNIFVFSAA
jgi:hypothetical protein